MASRAIVASLWNFAGSWGQQLASVAIFLYLVRTLDAADFGLMALAAAAIDVMTVFGRFGQVEALMQRRFVSQKTASTSFWVLFSIGVVSFIMFVAGAESLSNFMGDDRVASIILVLAPVPLIFNLTQVHEYFLRRDFQFKGLALRNVSATTISGIVAVIAANLGYGFYALVLQKLVFTIVYAVSLGITYRWWPSFTFSGPAAFRLSRSGIDIVVANIIPMLNLRIIDVLVGYYLGVVALGYLRTAGRLYELMFQLIVNPILSVSMTSLTAVKGNAELLRSTYLLYLRVILILSTPMFSAAALLGDDIIHIAAGSGWEGSIVPFRLFCLTTAGLTIIYTFIPLMLSVDRTRTIRDQAFFQFGFTAATTFAATQVSLFAVLVTHVIRVYVLALIDIVLIAKHASITVHDLMMEVAPPIIVSILMTVVMLAVSQSLESRSMSPTVNFLLTGMAGGCAFISFLLIGAKFRIFPDYLTTLFTIVRQKTRTRPI